jgi:hypothetical protein
MEAASSSEGSVTVYQLTWFHIPGDMNLHQHHFENLVSCIVEISFIVSMQNGVKSSTRQNFKVERLHAVHMGEYSDVDVLSMDDNVVPLTALGMSENHLGDEGVGE